MRGNLSTSVAGEGTREMMIWKVSALMVQPKIQRVATVIMTAIDGTGILVDVAEAGLESVGGRKKRGVLYDETTIFTDETKPFQSSTLIVFDACSSNNMIKCTDPFPSSGVQHVGYYHRSSSLSRIYVSPII